LIGLLVAQLVRDVGEPRLARADALGPAHACSTVAVAGVGVVAQGGKHHDVKPSSSAKLDSGMSLTS